MEMYLRTIRLFEGDIMHLQLSFYGSPETQNLIRILNLIQSLIVFNYIQMLFNKPLISLLRVSFDQSEHVITRLVVFIVSNILFLLSFIVLPLASVWDFLRRKKLSLIQAVLHTYYGLLGGWGERLNKPIAHLLTTGLILGTILTIVPDPINPPQCVSMESCIINLGSIDLGSCTINWGPIDLGQISLTLHVFYVILFPLSNPLSSPFLNLQLENPDDICCIFLFFILTLAKIYGLTLLTILAIALKRKFSRISAQ